jgi:uncharacterized protein (TIGR02001 family)
MVMLSNPVLAQVSGALTVENDYEVRGYSLSARKPAAVLDLSYEHPSGLYFNGSAIADLDDNHDPALLGLIANVGYASRITPRLSVDGGVTHLELFQRYGQSQNLGYTEAYLGLTGYGFSSHIYASPDYYRPGVKALYGEVKWSHALPAKFQLSLHAGALGYLSLPAAYASRSTQYDWRVGLSRPVGAFDVFAAVTGGGPAPDYYDLHPHSRTALTVGANWAF